MGVDGCMKDHNMQNAQASSFSIPVHKADRTLDFTKNLT